MQVALLFAMFLGPLLREDGREQLCEDERAQEQLENSGRNTARLRHFGALRPGP